MIVSILSPSKNRNEYFHYFINKVLLLHPSMLISYASYTQIYELTIIAGSLFLSNSFFSFVFSYVPCSLVSLYRSSIEVFIPSLLYTSLGCHSISPSPSSLPLFSFSFIPEALLYKTSSPLLNFNILCPLVPT